MSSIYGLDPRRNEARIAQWYTENACKHSDVWHAGDNGFLTRSGWERTMRRKMVNELCVVPASSDRMSPVTLANHTKVSHSTICTIVRRVRADGDTPKDVAA